MTEDLPPVDEDGLFEPDLALENARAQLAGLIGGGDESPERSTLDADPPSEIHGDTLRPEPIEDSDYPSSTSVPTPLPTAVDGLRAHDERFETPEDPRIPEGKSFFKIGEVAKLTDVKPYVLRYWETEFPWIKPTKTSSRQRLFRRQDVALIFQIKRLRYEEEMTIAATRQQIKELRGDRPGRPRRGSSKKKAASVEAPVTASVAPAQLTNALADMRRSVLDLRAVVEN